MLTSTWLTAWILAVTSCPAASISFLATKGRSIHSAVVSNSRGGREHSPSSNTSPVPSHTWDERRRVEEKRRAEWIKGKWRTGGEQSRVGEQDDKWSTTREEQWAKVTSHLSDNVSNHARASMQVSTSVPWHIRILMPGPAQCRSWRGRKSLVPSVRSHPYGFYGVKLCGIIPY